MPLDIYFKELTALYSHKFDHEPKLIKISEKS